MSPTNLAYSTGGPPSGARVFALRDLGLVCERLGTEKVGFGAVAWLRIGPAASGVRPLARSAGTEARALQIGETGQVPELQVENRGGWPLLLPAHLVLSGGWQTRAVERSVVVPSGGSARVPVKCVEAGRWAPRDERTARSFEVADHAGVRTRWSTSRSMAEQLTRHGRFAAEQSTVWQQIDEELTRSAVASRTRSYEAYIHGVRRRLVAEAHQAATRPPLAANGVVIFPRGGGFWIEAYPSAAALAEHADDLLADLFDDGASVDAGAARDGRDGRDVDAGPKPAAVPEASPQANAVDEHGVRISDNGGAAAGADGLLDALWSAPLHQLDRLVGTVGDSFAMSAGPERAAGAVLMVDGALAHLSVGAGPGGHDDGVSGDRRSSADRASDVADLVASAGAAPAGAASAGAASAGVASAGVAVAGAVGSAAPRPAEPAVPQPVAPATGSDPGNERPRVDLETMQRIFSRARDLLPEGPPARDRVQGYRLVRVLDRNISWVDIRITGDGYAVLGSHDRCDLVLSSDAGMWLRHLAAICVRLDDGSVGLRLIDLKTDLPFFLDDDTPRWSVLARGPFAMRLGRHVVCGFPIGPAPTDAVVGRGAVQDAGPHPSPGVVPRAHEPARARDVNETGVLETGISLAGDLPAKASVRPPEPRPVAAAPNANELASFVPSAPVSQIQDLLGPSASPQHVRVTLERGGMGASVELPTEALDAGVLLGRALNCFDGGLRRIFCEAISRAHVLLVRDRDEVFAFDLCSTNGTRVAGQRIRRHRLSDAGATVELGKKVIFRWHRRE